MSMSRLMLKLHQICAVAILLSVLSCFPTAAQTSVTVQGGNSEAWKKQPHTTVEGIVRSSTCGSLTIETEKSSVFLRVAESPQFFPPEGKEFLNFRRCMNYKGFRVRVTYTSPASEGCDGDFHVLQVIEAVSPGMGDDVPKFTDAGRPIKVEVPQHSIVKAKPLPEWTPPPKPWATADGVVNQVVCSQFDLMLTLQVSGFTLKLHTSNFKGPPYYATGGATRDGFDPCKGLRGRTVKIEYARVLSKPYVGELASIEIEE